MLQLAPNIVLDNVSLMKGSKRDVHCFIGFFLVIHVFNYITPVEFVYMYCQAKFMEFFNPIHDVLTMTSGVAESGINKT